ncbi:MAG: 2-phospho-L-lactate guanylyltransferase [Acidimicrobiaceae bacterium]|nr:2-phospho-L-lactate guanylyltransferase [Acidimicrobiaceae bacterium]MCY4279524.1 2-phospho-L-lactate guanylyltransferase [Acidimicrobiaceae bacterium]MCY4294049.1 2-phospho-L-lactate guanylyltransferase [Acidimicrobiaceae bacterium]
MPSPHNSAPHDSTAADASINGRAAGTPAAAVIVPIRSFDGALSRLESALGRSGCRQLMRRMAGRVLAAADGLAVHVASDDAEVAAWAENRAASVVRVGRPGLTAAVTTAVRQLSAAGVERVVVAHADLARARSLRAVLGSGMVIAPDRRRDGSNVICVAAGAGFRFSYGPGSFQRHLSEAERLGLAVTVLDDEDLAYDIDHPEDLLELSDAERVALGVERHFVSL